MIVLVQKEVKWKSQKIRGGTWEGAWQCGLFTGNCCMNKPVKQWSLWRQMREGALPLSAISCKRQPTNISFIFFTQKIVFHAAFNSPLLVPFCASWYDFCKSVITYPTSSRWTYNKNRSTNINHSAMIPFLLSNLNNDIFCLRTVQNADLCLLYKLRLWLETIKKQLWKNLKLNVNHFQVCPEKATITEMGQRGPRRTPQCKHQGVSQLTSWSVISSLYTKSPAVNNHF